jgi:hypothetical protein
VKTAATVVKRAAVTAGKAVYKASGIQSIVSCVTNPNLASCVKAAVIVGGPALSIATGGLSVGVEVAVDAAADAATDVAADAAADATEDVADTEGGGVLDSLKETAGDVWTKIKPAGTSRPVLQLGLGAAWGAATGAAANLGGGTLRSTLGAGFASGAGDAVGTDVINNHRLPTSAPALWG